MARQPFLAGDVEVWRTLIGAFRKIWATLAWSWWQSHEPISLLASNVRDHPNTAQGVLLDDTILYYSDPIQTENMGRMDDPEHPDEVAEFLCGLDERSKYAL